MYNRLAHQPQHLKQDNHERFQRKSPNPHHGSSGEDKTHDKVSNLTSLSDIGNICRQPPQMQDMEKVQNDKCIFMIAPVNYDSSRHHEPKPLNNETGYIDRWDEHHVRMPCSPKYTDRYGKPRWSYICQQLAQLKQKCNDRTANFEDLKHTIENCVGRHYNMDCLAALINKIFSDPEYTHFMTTVLSNICSLAMNVDQICGQPPPLLRIGSNRSVTMSQQQAASLLACAFFCLFPVSSDHEQNNGYQKFQEPNFNRLYQRGPPQKIEKLKCIIHYFRRITEIRPFGVISFRRFALPGAAYPKWSNSTADLSPMHLTIDKKIEDIKYVLQVDFANEYIGGGVLGSGCVQEEIRFSICPEMLVSLLVCEVMEPNECIFLIGCERYSLYKGYGDQFQFDGNYDDRSPRDNWGRKWCHLVAMDAICFRNPEKQYDMEYVDRELIKAYTSFRPRATKTGAETLFGIATGNWGCGVFNGDKQLKAIIQLMAASLAGRPLVYAAFLDKHLFQSFSYVYAHLLRHQVKVGDLYRYLQQYSSRRDQITLFDYILSTPISSLKS